MKVQLEDYENANITDCECATWEHGNSEYGNQVTKNVSTVERHGKCKHVSHFKIYNSVFLMLHRGFKG